MPNDINHITLLCVLQVLEWAPVCSCVVTEGKVCDKSVDNIQLADNLKDQIMKFNYLECRILYKNKKTDRIDTKRQVVTSKIIINERLQGKLARVPRFFVRHFIYSSLLIFQHFEKGESSEQANKAVCLHKGIFFNLSKLYLFITGHPFNTFQTKISLVIVSNSR